MVLGLIMMDLVNGDGGVDDRWLDGLLLDDWLDGLEDLLVTPSFTARRSHWPHEHDDAHARRQLLVQRSGSP